MIIVRLKGGLGNQMFQYAAARRLSHVSRVPLKLDLGWFDAPEAGTTSRQYALHPLNIREDILASEESDGFLSCFGRLASLAGRFTPFGPVYLREKHYHFDPALLAPRKKAYLDGYWQSEKYFSDIREIICSEFAVRQEPEGLNRTLADRLGDPGFCSVALHVRRGDYIDSPSAAKVHGSCSPRYYSDAVKLVSERCLRPHFFIFSDDPDWVRGNFSLEHPCTVVGHNGPDQAHEDLRLMTLCRHHVIANSSFSWWGAWLCRNDEKLVVAPTRWFADAPHDERDVVPESWLRV